MKSGRAFTLIELVVVVAVIAQVLDQWRRTAARLATASEARLVLNQLAEDLQGAILRGDGNVWLAVTVLPDERLSGQWQTAVVAAQAKPANTHPRTLNLAAPELADARFGVAGVWLRLIATKSDTGASATELSAPVAVGWQIVRRRLAANPAAEERYLLFRAEVRRTASAGGAPGTFESGYDLDPAASPATPYQTASGTAGDPGNLIRPPLGAAFADNVIDFGVRLYVREGANLRLVFPAGAAARGAAPKTGALTAATPPSEETQHLACRVAPAAGDYYRHAFPNTADLMVRVLTEEGAQLIAAYESGRLRPPAGVAAADYWWTLAEAHSEVFTARIAVPSRPW